MKVAGLPKWGVVLLLLGLAVVIAPAWDCQSCDRLQTGTLQGDICQIGGETDVRAPDSGLNSYDSERSAMDFEGAEIITDLHIPPIDASAQARTETATFALG